MPATVNSVKINLLSKDSRQTAEGRIVNWTLTYGRYIMIGTEIVVLLAFISRFSLDRKRTDLQEEIAQKQAILEANLPFELEIRNTQDNLEKIKVLLGEQDVPVSLLKRLAAILPPDVYLKSLDITQDSLHSEAVAGTTEGFSQFLANLGATKELTKVQIADISKNSTVGITFDFNAAITKKK